MTIIIRNHSLRRSLGTAIQAQFVHALLAAEIIKAADGILAPTALMKGLSGLEMLERVFLRTSGPRPCCFFIHASHYMLLLYEH